MSGSGPGQVTSVVEASGLQKTSCDSTGVVQFLKNLVKVVTTDDWSNDEDQEQEEDCKVDD